ncbi:DNA gyrase subunit A [Patescibacteria group bacterium]|nr:DNA gyrase subunit A [Patescibacteria group bacterium]
MDTGNVKPQEIVQEMQTCYLDYAMSVIVGRALPDVRDGLKPVHRRILYAMWDMGLRSGAKLRKSATVVGEVLGKYHPHGDIAVYDTMVRLAQDFSMRYPMIQGQGNFGSLDGDAAAAHRYTECRLTALAEEMMQDIDKDTVKWTDNYDGTRQEPMVLPAKLPQLLLNGSLGIAVGMATSIPPHNLTELVDGITYLIEKPKSTSEDLMKFIKGPDFPTGGAIYDRQAIAQAYSTGKGAVVNRAIAEIVEDKKSAKQIIISEIPYQVNKATLLETIADLVKDKKIDGIKDIRDESDKDGVRVVIDLKSEAYPQKTLNRLYKLTDLQKTFHLNMLALVDGLQPQVLPLKAFLEQYVEHRYNVVTRRTKFDLDRAKERAHILEGLKKALDHIDAIIAVIKKSADKEEAHAALCKKFKLSEAQSTAILEMKLQTLAGLERKKIEDELKEKKRLIAELEELLKSPKKILGVIKTELVYLKEKFGDERRTKVFASPVGEFKEEDLIPEEDCIITLTEGGYIKRMNPKNYKAQHRGGKGISGITTREEDLVKYLASVNTHDNLLFFTNTGRVFRTKSYEIPEASRVARGQALVNFLELGPKEEVSALVALKENLKNKKKNGAKTAPSAANGALANDEENFLVMATQNGIIKKTAIEDFSNVRRSGLIAIGLDKGDLLRWVKSSSGKDEIILVTAKGQSVRFKEKDARPMGRSAGGTRGLRLKKGDAVVGMDIVKSQKSKVPGLAKRSGAGKSPADAKALAGKQDSKLERQELLVVTENGYGKKTDLKQFKVQRRGGSGIKAAQVTPKTGQIVAAKILAEDEEDVIAISQHGQVIRTALGSISLLGRATQGVRIMKLDDGDKVASVTCI